MRNNPTNSRYYFPLTLEFCSSLWSVNMVLARCSCWFSGEKACCADSQESLPWMKLRCPFQGTRLTTRLRVALGGFCSLKAFRAALEVDSENGGLPLSSPRPRAEGPTPQCALREKQSIIPGHLIPVCTLYLVCDWAFLSLACDPVWSSQNPQHLATHMCATASRGGGGVGEVSQYLSLAGPLLGEQSCDQALASGLWPPWAESPLLASLIASLSDAWELNHTQAPDLPVIPKILRLHCPT